MNAHFRGNYPETHELTHHSSQPYPRPLAWQPFPTQDGVEGGLGWGGADLKRYLGECNFLPASACSAEKTERRKHISPGRQQPAWFVSLGS